MKKTLLALSGAVLIAGCAAVEEKQPVAVAKLEPRSGTNVRGTVTFTQIGDVVRVTGEITGHSPGPKGFHIHEKGDCSAPDAMSAGGHFNPHKSKHGGPYDPVKHAGDLGNIVFDKQGVAKVNFTVGDISVSRDRADGIIGRALVVHVQPDDLKTDPTGNAGGRAACGVIQAG
ncbi:MAG TPA: superoxide dismutase family protein [Burkholderiales bacterium]|nr:superoxide dismutase family protein [Burkholderiales bacterium]